MPAPLSSSMRWRDVLGTKPQLTSSAITPPPLPSNHLDLTRLYSTLLSSTLLYSPLLYSTLHYSTLLSATLLYSTLLYSTPSQPSTHAPPPTNLQYNHVVHRCNRLQCSRVVTVRDWDCTQSHRSLMTSHRQQSETPGYTKER